MITNNIIKRTKEFLREDGVSFFNEMMETYGEVNAVFMEGGIPHPVHNREGMQVRNFLRTLPDCKDWDCNDYDNNWVEVIERVLNEE